MVFSNVLLPLCILFAGIIAATIHIRNKSSYLRQTHLIHSPMIGNVRTNNKEGPWPDCIGMTGEECESYVRHYACHGSAISNSDCQVVIVPLDYAAEVPQDFLPNRIRIFVDDSGYVALIPDRG